MAFDFTTIYDRHGKDALAVDAIGQIEGVPKRHRKVLALFQCG